MASLGEQADSSDDKVAKLKAELAQAEADEKKHKEAKVCARHRLHVCLSVCLWLSVCIYTCVCIICESLDVEHFKRCDESKKWMRIDSPRQGFIDACAHGSCAFMLSSVMIKEQAESYSRMSARMNPEEAVSIIVQQESN
jgi:hypothetical protein